MVMFFFALHAAGRSLGLMLGCAARGVVRTESGFFGTLLNLAG